ncbi:MAG: HD domain-containing protein [Gemmatimonadales bacterium]|nr:HD domain-containing protein [Gemmatimonadales bacterium]NIQ98651.1 HD domain-containing protein [Gemmatimonadales bacterium]
MTQLETETPDARKSLVDALESSERDVREKGREFLSALYTSLRCLKLYPVENEQVQRALDRLESSAKNLYQIERALELRVSHEFLYINSVRLRLSLENYAIFSHVRSTLRQCGVGTVGVEENVGRREWQVFLSQLLAFSPREAVPDLSGLWHKMAEGGVTNIVLKPPPEYEEPFGDSDAAKDVAKRAYERGVAVTKELINGVRMGRTASAKRIKRAVQNIVDQVLRNEISLLGLTTIRGYDEQIFTHSVNVCIFSVSIGKRIGLTKLQLYDLGMAALLHDFGKSRVPLNILNSEAPLTDAQLATLQSHPWLGVLALFGLRGHGEVPYRAMIASYEHHLKTDLSGYPETIEPRQLSIFSKIVAVANGYDAPASRPHSEAAPIQSDEVLREMWTDKSLGYDPTIVKALINLLGIYPAGTCVILDSYEIGVVQGANPDQNQLNRPLVRIVCTPDGGRPDPAPVVNLATTDEAGHYERSIIKVTDGSRYGINPAEYLI